MFLLLARPEDHEIEELEEKRRRKRIEDESIAQKADYVCQVKKEISSCSPSS